MPEPIFDSPEDGAEPHENIIQTKKCPEPNPTNWPADVPTLPGVPTISDFSKAEHNVDVTNTEFENAKKAAASVVGNAAESSKPKRFRYSYKDRGVQGNKNLFIKPEFIELYTTVSSDVLAVGKIIEVPRSTNMNYVVNWLNLPTADLPVNFNRDHLRTHINKASKIEMDILKAGRNSFDQKYTNTKNPLGNKKAKRNNRKKAAVPSELPSITIARGRLRREELRSWYTTKSMRSCAVSGLTTRWCRVHPH